MNDFMWEECMAEDKKGKKSKSIQCGWATVGALQLFTLLEYRDNEVAFIVTDAKLKPQCKP